MDECGNRVSVAAWAAGIDRTHAYKILDSLGISYPKKKIGGNAAWKRLLD
jgi:hypothetical protein